jgi:hypothetical protein
MSEPTKNKAEMATANNMKIIADLHMNGVRGSRRRDEILA